MIRARPRLHCQGPQGPPSANRSAVRSATLPRRALAAALLALAGCAGGPAPAPIPPPDTGFAALIGKLSEPGGFFPSDNLVSNETSYLHVLGTLAELGVTGGAYIGVGPDQNFSYIAQIRPELALLIDIRRDNLLHHLFFKAAFELARTRVEYLALLLARPVPEDLDAWRRADVTRIVEYIDSTQRDPQRFEATAARIKQTVQRFGLDLSEPDLQVIRQIHAAFHDLGLDLQYSWGSRYPTYRRLLLETDLEGRQRNYLADEESFLFLKELQRRNRVVPVVGDLSGPHALAAIGKELAARNLTLSAFYVSNVEQYLMRGTSFQRYAETVSTLPFAKNGVLIRSYFGRYGSHPYHVPGHLSTQLLEFFADFAAEHRAGGYRGYGDLIIKNVLPLRAPGAQPRAS